jgi:hypothetical protein
MLMIIKMNLLIDLLYFCGNFDIVLNWVIPIKCGLNRFKY